jgi:hypothetical protein
VRCHCTLCHETFATYGVSDHHWIKDGHVHPRDVKGFWTDDEGFWHFGTRRDVARILRTTQAPIREPEVVS